MPGPDLRPLSLGELLDRTFTLYRGHFWLFAGITALPQIVVVLLNLLYQGLQAAPVMAPASTPAEAAAQFSRVMEAALVALFLALIVYWFIYSLAWGATTVAVSEVYLGHAATIRGSYRRVGNRFWGLVDVVFSVMLRVFGLFLLTILGFSLATAGMFAASGKNPVVILLVMLVLLLSMAASFALAIWLGLRYGVAIPALLLEELKARQAIRRSVTLTRGYRGRVFLTFLLMAFITWAVTALFQGPFLIALAVMAKSGNIPFWLRALSVISGGIGGTLSAPLLMIALSLLYYDVRVRKEAFDLQVMMAALGPATPPPAPQTSAPPAVTET